MACSLIFAGQATIFMSRASAAPTASGWWRGSPEINQGFGCTGYEKEPARGTCAHFHGGIDVGLSCDVPIFAPVDVTYLGINQESGYGTTDPMVRLPNGHDILLAHARNVQVSQVGGKINRGAVIAYVGGNQAAEGYPDWSGGCHLHFEARPGGGASSSSIDPTSDVYQTPGITGSWVSPTPGDGSAVLVNPLGLQVKVHAQDFTGSGLSRVNVRWAAEGTDQWSTQTHWIALGTTTFSDDYSYTFPSPAGGWPNSVILNFDVYANNQKVNFAHEGLRRVCLSGRTCPTTTATPPQGSGLGGGGSSSGGGGSGSSQTSCVPGQYQVAVFTDPNYQGNCVIKGIGEYPTPETIGLPNDSISSVKVGSGANVRLCENSGLTSPCFYYSADDDRLGYFDSLTDNSVSSMKVEGGGPTTNCVPGESEVAFFMDENYNGTCILRGIGRYDDPAALGLPNDTISSLKIGNRVRVRVCANNGNNSPCDQFENNVPDLGPTTVQNNTASSAEITSRGGIALCDNTNYGGECKYYGAGLTGESLYNMSNQGFDNRVESVRYDADWAHMYHIVLYTDQNQSGYLYHADDSVADLHDPYNNNISSVKIYRNQAPNSSVVAPANGTIFPASTTSVVLQHRDGYERHVHIWNSNFDLTTNWATGDSTTINNLTPGTYSWQVQARDTYTGEGVWSAISTFSINTPPTVTGGSLTMDAGTSQSIQVQAVDNEGGALTLTASGLPSFATFADNGGGIGTLAFNPTASQAGTYNITVNANDGSATGSGVIVLTVSAPPAPAGYQATYFNNLTLSGTPVLTRTEQAIDNDWGSGGPGSGVNVDNFSARWTKTIDFAAGTYRFSVTADDGVRLYIDDVLSIDKWIDQGSTTYTVDKTFTAGNHTIKMEYYDSGWDAVAKFSYQTYTAPAPAPGLVSGNTYKLINPNGNKALDVTGAGTSDGTKLQIWTDTGGAAQKWRITQNSDGTYKLINPNSSKAMDVNGAGTTDGTAVQIWTDNNGNAQKWAITKNSDGTYKLTNPNSGKVLDVNGGSSADGTKVQIWTDNGSLAQKWQLVDVTGQAPPPAPTFTGNGTVSASTIVAGNTITMNGSFTSTSSTNSTTRIHFEVRSPSDQQVFAKDFDNEAFTPGQTKNYTATWAIPATTAAGAYVVKGGAVSADWGTWYLWLNNMGQFTVTAPPPQTGGTELLTAPWNLVGNNGANEKYQSIAANALAGKTTLRVTYNLHGLNALGGDASAIIFDQNGWKYVSLSNYGQNGLNGAQTVDIPLSAFGLNLSQSVGTLHTRFWYGSSFTVEITSVKVL